MHVEHATCTGKTFPQRPPKCLVVGLKLIIHVGNTSHILIIYENIFVKFTCGVLEKCTWVIALESAHADLAADPKLLWNIGLGKQTLLPPF